MIVLGGSASNGIDSSIAKILGVKQYKAEITRFPDGEIKVRLPADVENEEVLIVQSTQNPQEKNLFEIVLMADALRDKAKSIIALIPYLAYARQNKSFLEGEAVSIDTVLSMLSNSGISGLVTVNPHKKEPLQKFAGNVQVVDAVGALAEKVKSTLEKPFVMAPDIGGLGLAKEAAELLGCEYTYLEKQRESAVAVTIAQTHGGDFKGKDVVIFDDIISTGGTIELAAKFAYSQGARSVSTAAVHLVMVEGAYEKLKAAKIDKIFGTNTIPFDKAIVADVAPCAAEGVKKLSMQGRLF